MMMDLFEAADILQTLVTKSTLDKWQAEDAEKLKAEAKPEAGETE